MLQVFLIPFFCGFAGVLHGAYEYMFDALLVRLVVVMDLALISCRGLWESLDKCSVVFIGFCNISASICAFNVVVVEKMTRKS